ncbi:MAG: radical SAM protein [Candidatus Tectimicrobiota bacterium]|nr:MAG: radical SAM protein [Candidatus Tectomicrobia bacterium]
MERDPSRMLLPPLAGSGLAPEPVSVRPPSEAHSVLLRVTRGCAWNRCTYCGLYRDVPSSQRSVEEITQDLALLALQQRQPVRTVFLGDGDALELDTASLEAVLHQVRACFPAVERITAYATALSVQAKSDGELRRLRQAGLQRLHIGLESGDDTILRDVLKGVSAAEMIEAGQRVRAAGIELSFYVMLGLGGIERWQAHVQGTARVLNRVDPEWIRLRTLAYDPRAPLFSRLDARAGRFVLKLPQGRYREVQTPLGLLHELHALLQQLTEAHGIIVADHHTNPLADFAGKLPEARARLLRQVEARMAEVAAGRVRLPRLPSYL